MIRRPPRSTLFPYTTLFRSKNLLFFPDQIAQLRRHSVLPFEVHLMVTDPMGWVDTFVEAGDRKSTRLNSSHVEISYAVFCLKKKKNKKNIKSIVIKKCNTNH